METIELADAQTRLSDLVSALRPGEEFILSRNQIPVARVLSLEARPKTGGELAKLWPTRFHLTPEEADLFEADLEEARRKLPFPEAPKWE